MEKVKLHGSASFDVKSTTLTVEEFIDLLSGEATCTKHLKRILDHEGRKYRQQQQQQQAQVDAENGENGSGNVEDRAPLLEENTL